MRTFVRFIDIIVVHFYFVVNNKNKLWGINLEKRQLHLQLPLLYKFVTSCIIAYVFSLIVVNIWKVIEYIWNILNLDDSEWIDESTKNEVTEER